jgi:hypothetical protein
MSRKKLILIVTLSLIALLILSAWSPWDAFRYQGDGKFSDGGFFGHPRYVVAFSDISLNEVGEYHFRFRGLPNEEMTLVLYVKDRSVSTAADRGPLEGLKTTIDASLTDDHGSETCRGSGQPGSGNKDGIWVLMERGDESGFWHWRCTHVKVHPNVSYTLIIRVTSTDPKGEKVVVIPRFEGGGLDLP